MLFSFWRLQTTLKSEPVVSGWMYSRTSSYEWMCCIFSIWRQFSHWYMLTGKQRHWNTRRLIHYSFTYRNPEPGAMVRSLSHWGSTTHSQGNHVGGRIIFELPDNYLVYLFYDWFTLRNEYEKAPKISNFFCIGNWLKWWFLLWFHQNESLRRLSSMARKWRGCSNLGDTMKIAHTVHIACCLY